jgi:hypothetical protein
LVYIKETHEIEPRTVTANETVRRGKRTKKGRLETKRANAIGQSREMRRFIPIQGGKRKIFVSSGVPRGAAPRTR